TRAWPRAPTPELQGHLKEAQPGEECGGALECVPYIDYAPLGRLCGNAFGAARSKHPPDALKSVGYKAVETDHDPHRDEQQHDGDHSCCQRVRDRQPGEAYAR